MDQALKSLIASEEEVVASLGLSRQWHLFSLTSRPSPVQRLRLLSLSCSRSGAGAGLPNSACCHSSLTTLLFSFLPRPSPTVPPPPPPPARPTASPHCALTLHPATRPCSKCGDLEEELKIVTNNLKSLEAQADKV